jgi:hypothetical protein
VWELSWGIGGDWIGQGGVGSCSAKTLTAYGRAARHPLRMTGATYFGRGRSGLLWTTVAPTLEVLVLVRVSVMVTA